MFTDLGRSSGTAPPLPSSEPQSAHGKLTEPSCYPILAPPLPPPSLSIQYPTNSSPEMDIRSPSGSPVITPSASSPTDGPDDLSVPKRAVNNNNNNNEGDDEKD